MRRSISLIAMAAILISLSAAYAIHRTMPAETYVSLPGAYAESVYKYISYEDPYKKWSLWPGKGRLYKGKQPHGAYLTTYVKDNARFSVRAGGKMVNGSIIVNENYTSEKKLIEIMVMYKVKNYNPSAGDWFWAGFDKKGKVLEEGKVRTCIDCHSKMKSNDYIFTEMPAGK